VYLIITLVLGRVGEVDRPGDIEDLRRDEPSRLLLHKGVDIADLQLDTLAVRLVVGEDAEPRRLALDSPLGVLEGGERGLDALGFPPYA
jgi:hypothetical protein